MFRDPWLSGIYRDSHPVLVNKKPSCDGAIPESGFEAAAPASRQFGDTVTAPVAFKDSFILRIASVLAAALLIALLVGCADSDPTDAESQARRSSKRVPVVAVPVISESLKASIKAVGTARAKYSVNVFPETAGIVTAIGFDADTVVDGGAVLLELDDRDETLAVALAKVELADAKRLVKRYTTVNRDTANIAQSEIDSARAAVDAAEIALDQAEVALARRQVLAPFAGRVGITDIDVGDRIDTATQITTLDDRSVLFVDFAVPEVYVGQVTNGTNVNAQLFDRTGEALSGRVVAVDSRVDAGSRAFTARAAIDNADDRFRPGMAFEISIDVDRGVFLSVPDVSVQWGADGPYVWIATDGKASRREVALVERLPSRLLLRAEIDAGELVIAEGVQGVREGIDLTVLDAAALDRDPRGELADNPATAEVISDE